MHISSWAISKGCPCHTEDPFCLLMLSFMKLIDPSTYLAFHLGQTSTDVYGMQSQFRLDLVCVLMHGPIVS